MPKGYEADFRKADQTFLYQLVFDPCTQQQVRLHPLPGDVDTTDFEFAGMYPSFSLCLCVRGGQGGEREGGTERKIVLDNLVSGHLLRGRQWGWPEGT